MPMSRRPATVVGVIADTHGLLRPAAVAALQECAVIVHAGDIGKHELLARLVEIAPLTAIRGNVDLPWAHALPDTAELTVDRRKFFVLHNLRELTFDPASAGFDVVISGHSHMPKIERKAGVLYVNPGSAGPRRFRLPVAVARVTLTTDAIDAEIVDLPV
jgi:putative phosphoesterase